MIIKEQLHKVGLKEQKRCYRVKDATERVEAVEGVHTKGATWATRCE